MKVKVGCLCHSAAIALEFHHATIQLPIQALIQVVRPKYMRCEVFINMFAFKVPAVSAALLVDASFQPDEREANAPRYKT